MIFLYITLFLILTLVFTFYKRVFLIPLAFIMLYVVNAHIPDYFGYAVKSNYIGDREAVVLQTVGNHYLLVVLNGDDQPRLVWVNKIDNETKEKLKKNETVIIKFNSNNFFSFSKQTISNFIGATSESEGFSSSDYAHIKAKDSKKYGKDQ